MEKPPVWQVPALQARSGRRFGGDTARLRSGVVWTPQHDGALYSRNMTPLSDDEKVAVVRAYEALKGAIEADPAGVDVAQSHKKFLDVYRGDSIGFVENLPEPERRQQWIGQLFLYLHGDEIEERFWRHPLPPPEDGQDAEQ